MPLTGTVENEEDMWELFFGPDFIVHSDSEIGKDTCPDIVRKHTFILNNSSKKCFAAKTTNSTVMT